MRSRNYDREFTENRRNRIQIRKTKNNKKIREIWLTSFITVILVSFFLSNFWLLIKTSKEWPTLIEKQANAYDIAMFFTIHLINHTFNQFIGIIGALMLYYFSYKKSGTKFLLLNLILMPISMLVLLAGLFGAIFLMYVPAKIPATQYLTPVTLFFSLLITIYFWVNCLRLYKVNKAKKTEKENAE